MAKISLAGRLRIAATFFQLDYASIKKVCTEGADEIDALEAKVAGLIRLAAEHMEEENKARSRIVMLEQALDDALGEWHYNATTYKSDPLVKKHADLEQIAHYRKLLNDKIN